MLDELPFFGIWYPRNFSVSDNLTAYEGVEHMSAGHRDREHSSGFQFQFGANSLKNGQGVTR